MVKNSIKQKELDKEKWLKSELCNEDMSGAMYYCDACMYQCNGFACGVSHDDRVGKCLCAKAYNRLRRTFP